MSRKFLMAAAEVVCLAWATGSAQGITALVGIGIIGLTALAIFRHRLFIRGRRQSPQKKEVSRPVATSPA